MHPHIEWLKRNHPYAEYKGWQSSLGFVVLYIPSAKPSKWAKTIFHPDNMCIVPFILPSTLYKRFLWRAPALHAAPITPMDLDTACDIASATYGYHADLPLQRLSRTRRGWQMAEDGFWSPPPGDVSAGCRIDTPGTWTASGGGAALAPALRCHGNPRCSETRVHLVDRWRRKRKSR